VPLLLIYEWMGEQGAAGKHGNRGDRSPKIAPYANKWVTSAPGMIALINTEQWQPSGSAFEA
jgi:hypothetical protein